MSSADLPSLRILIVDDEPDARELLLNWLAELDGVEIAGVAGDAFEAIELIQTCTPNLVLLDIHMPELNAFGLIAQVGNESMPQVIFSTAYDEFAVRAFEVNAVDYLLKPFSLRRLKQAIDRSRVRMSKPGTGQSTALKDFLFEFQRMPNPDSKNSKAKAYLTRIVVKSINPWKTIDCREILAIHSDGAYTNIETAGKLYTHFESISSLEECLDPRQFMRVHRNAIINLCKVLRITTLPYGARQAVLENGTKVKVSRSYRVELQARLVLISEKTDIG